MRALALAACLSLTVCSAQYWQEVGAGSASGGGLSQNTTGSEFAALAMASDAAIAVAWHDGGLQDIHVRRWDGTAWYDVGTGGVIPGGRAGALSAHPALSFLPDGGLVAAWVEEATALSFKIHVRRWDGAAWIEMGAGSATGNGVSSGSGWCLYPALAVGSNGGAAVAWQDDSAGNEEICIRSWDGAAWLELGTGSGTAPGISGTFGRSIRPALALDADGRPVVAWLDDTAGGFEVYVRRWTGTVWSEIGSGSASARGISASGTVRSDAAPALVVDAEDRPVIAWADDVASGSRITVRRWTGGAWQDVGEDAAAGAGAGVAGACRHVTLAMAARTTPVIAWEALVAGTPRIYVRRWDGLNWGEMGADSASGAGVGGGDAASRRPALAAAPDSASVALAWDTSCGPPNTEVYLRLWDGRTEDVTPPTATIQSLDAPALGASAVTFAVRYADDQALDRDTVDGDDIVVVGPTGTAISTTLASVEPAEPAAPPELTGHYALSAPDGRWSPNDNGIYSIYLQGNAVRDAAGNAAAAVLLGSFTVSLVEPAPVIVVHPDWVLADPGSEVTLEVSVADPQADVSYQWHCNGVDIEGATDRRYVIPAVAADSAGRYRCAVTGGGDPVLSDEAEVAVTGTAGTWMVRLVVAGATPAELAFGMSAAASAGADGFDLAVPGAADRGDGMVDWLCDDRLLVRDIRPLADTAWWFLTVSAGMADAVLTWDAADALPADRCVSLFERGGMEPHGNTSIDLARGQGLRVPAGTTRHYVLRYAADQAVDIALRHGWNLISIPLEPTHAALPRLLQPFAAADFGRVDTAGPPKEVDVGAPVCSVWRWRETGCEPALGAHALEGLFVFAVQPCLVLVCGLPSASIRLAPGWNLLGPSAAVAVPPTAVPLGWWWHWDSRLGALVRADHLERTRGYWVYATDPTQLEFPLGP